jgi:DnaJ-class molecular chaperone
MADAAPQGVPSERERVEALRTLGLPRRARTEEVRAAYLKLARDLHPDLNPGDEAVAARFQRIATAYQLLRRHQRHVTTTPTFDPAKREKPSAFDERWWSAFGDRV